MATDADNLITRNQAARLLGCAGRSLTRYASRDDDPLLPERAGGHGKPTLYDPRTVADWHLRQELAKLQEQAGHDDAIDFHHERARLTRAQAEAQELKNKITRREYARIELLTFAMGNVCSQVSAGLEVLPGKIKRLEPKLSANDIQAIRREIVALQNGLASIDVDWTDAPEIDEE
ncbi:MAG: terminase small subunit [Xanthomonadales bacterium]|nr:terminase small subunit [Xanthomonadales bacterium]